MEHVKEEVLLPKASLLVGEGLAKVYAVAKKQLENGWQSGDDVGPIVASVLGDLMPALKSVAEVGGEVKEDAFGVSLAVLIKLYEALKA